MIATVRSADGLDLEVQGIIPKLSETPGAVRFRAPVLGEHTNDVLAAAGFARDEIASLKTQGVIS